MTLPTATHPSCASSSIQRQLLTALLLGLPLLWLAISLVMGWRLSHEIGEQSDTQLVQFAAYLAQLSDELDKPNAPDTTPPVVTIKTYQKNGDIGSAKDGAVSFAIWAKPSFGDAPTHVPSTPSLILADRKGQHFMYSANAQGFIEQRVKDRPWRLFFIQTPHHTVAVGQRVSERREMIVDTLLGQGVTMFVGLILLIVWVNWQVRRGIAPLSAISKQVAHHKPCDASPIDARVPQEIAPLVTELNQLFTRTAQVLAREQRFTADASHELRSPLTSLKLQADLLTQYAYDLPAEQAEPLLQYSQKITNGIQRANRLVEQLLVLAKIDPQHQLPPEARQPIDWLAISDAVLSEVNRPARERYSQLRRDITAPTPADILPLDGNPTLISLLLRNLLDNAIRYTPEGSRIRLTLAAKHISICDNGNGVPPEQLNRLTERFYRPAGQSQQGSGLGLSIVAQIAALHGLTLSFDNQNAPAHGLCVTLRRA
ncbi:ATP-binding protein [Faucicola atlantae]|uniref:ATP-binding protein n=1 Tax=Faucicola atlantae TaxID=34059 RepID=UPI0020A3D529|nr:ATP-binding protein [Moraxella atlantae]